MNKVDGSLPFEPVPPEPSETSSTWKGREVSIGDPSATAEKIEDKVTPSASGIVPPTGYTSTRVTDEVPKEHLAEIIALISSTVLDTDTPRSDTESTSTDTELTSSEEETSSIVASSTSPLTGKSENPPPSRSLAETWLLDRIAFFENQLKDGPENPLFTGAIEVLRSNLGFLLNPSEIPFRGCVSTDMEHMLPLLEKLNPGVTWTDAYKKCRETLASQMETFLPIIKQSRKDADVPSSKLYEYGDMIKRRDMEIVKSKGGFGGAHFCKTWEKRPELKAILKTVNGDVGTIDNIKGFNHPFLHSTIRPIVNYESVQKEALAYELSLAFGCAGSVPPTIMTTVKHPFESYFDIPAVKAILESCPEEVKADIIDRLGGAANPKRLCCLQEAVQNPIQLNDLILNWGQPGFEAHRFNPENYEDVIHMTRVLGETDGHADNYLITKKTITDEKTQTSHEEYFLVKVDSGFSLPKKNSGALNCLTSLPDSKLPLSERYRQKVLDTDSKKLRILAEKYHLDESEIVASEERIEFMKDLVRAKPGITHREFELRLRLFSGVGYKVNPDLDSRRKFALGDYSKTELKEFKKINRSKFQTKDSRDAVTQIQSGGLAKTGSPWRSEKVMIEKGLALLAKCNEDFSKLENELMQLPQPDDPFEESDIRNALGNAITLTRKETSEYVTEMKKLKIELEKEHQATGTYKKLLSQLLGKLEKYQTALKTLIEKIQGTADESEKIKFLVEYRTLLTKTPETPDESPRGSNYVSTVEDF